ncbi:MAG: FecR family protein, partial [Thermodesulfobacteriota bacterium]
MMNYLIGALLVMLLAWPGGARAAAVGRFTQVEGEVNLLKQGKLPALPVKLQDRVEPGDIIRTKSQARAQITLVDDTTISISPGSRVAIESYMYDAAKKERQGVVQVFYGMVYTVVSRIMQTEKPDFLLKTHTAIMGVRGTKWYAVLHPIATDVFNESGKVCAQNTFSEVVGEVCLKDREFTRVGWNLPPTIPAVVPLEDFLLLQRQLSTGVKGGQSGAGTPSGGAPTSLLPQPGQIPTPGIAETVIGAPTPPASILPMTQVTPPIIVPPAPPGPPSPP